MNLSATFLEWRRPKLLSSMVVHSLSSQSSDTPCGDTLPPEHIGPSHQQLNSYLPTARNGSFIISQPGLNNVYPVSMNIATRLEQRPQNIDQMIDKSTNDMAAKKLKADRRVLKNRQAALDSRNRKKKYTEELEGRNCELEDENKKLQMQLKNLIVEKEELLLQNSQLREVLESESEPLVEKQSGRSLPILLSEPPNEAIDIKNWCTFMADDFATDSNQQVFNECDNKFATDIENWGTVFMADDLVMDSNQQISNECNNKLAIDIENWGTVFMADDLVMDSNQQM